MGAFIQTYSFPRNTRLLLTAGEFIAQLGIIKDQKQAPMIFGPRFKGLTKAGEGYNVEYPTARVTIQKPKPELLPEGDQKNLFVTLLIELLFNVGIRDEDENEIEIQEEAFGFADYVWNWLTPWRSDNTVGMVPKYPDIWRWNDKLRSENDMTRTLARIGPETSKMSGSLYVVTLQAPLIVFNPLVPYPIV